MTKNIIKEYLKFLQELSINSIKIKLLNYTETKKFISTLKDASPKYTQSNYQIYGAINRGVIIGGIVINTQPNLKNYKKYNLKCEAAVTFIYIMNKYRKMGLGEKLSKIPLKKYKSLCGTTNTGYTTDAAYKIFKKHNFKEVEKKGKTSFWYWRK